MIRKDDFFNRVSTDLRYIPEEHLSATMEVRERSRSKEKVFRSQADSEGPTLGELSSSNNNNFPKTTQDQENPDSSIISNYENPFNLSKDFDLKNY